MGKMLFRTNPQNATETEWSKADQIGAIWRSIVTTDGMLAARMLHRVSWLGAVRRFPDMTPEEIASMAADGFEVAP